MTYIVFLWGRQGIATNTQYDSFQFSTMKNILTLVFSFVVVLSLIRLSMQVQDEEVKRNRKHISEIHNYIDYVRDHLDEMQHEHHWLRRGERKCSRSNHPNTDSQASGIQQMPLFSNLLISMNLDYKNIELCQNEVHYFNKSSELFPLCSFPETGRNVCLFLTGSYFNTLGQLCHLLCVCCVLCVCVRACVRESYTLLYTVIHWYTVLA